MFGDEEYLEMFIEVYASTMQYLQLPINIRNHSFLVDVHMDSGEDENTGKPLRSAQVHMRIHRNILK